MATVVANPSDNQEVFDYVVNALRKQGCKSVDDRGHCRYRGLNDSKCAAGHLIPDEDMIGEFEGYSVDIELEHEVSRYFNKHRYDLHLIRKLQNIHDGHSVIDWELEFKWLAGECGLTYTKPQQVAT